MSFNSAIRARALSKGYEIYARPYQRLLQTFGRGTHTFYRRFWALRELSFDVQVGETVGVIGRNGSGKSTLLQLLAGTLLPTAGALELHGRVAALLELGAGFNAEFTGRENVYLSAAIMGLSRSEIDSKYESIIAFADIGEFINQPVKTYSSGMYVRLAFAVAISVTPEILLVDEALSVGDIFFQQKCIQYMRENLNGTTKLIVSHDLHTIANMADRVLVLEAGRCIFEGSPIDAIEHYTRLMHTESFKTKTIAHPIAKEISPSSESLWQEVPEEKVGGAGEVRITHVAVTTADGDAIDTVRTGDRVIVGLRFSSVEPKTELIFGYIVNDRLGNAIFGENSVSSSQFVPDIRSGGDYRVSFEFEWPEVRPDDYTITLGIGQGSDPVNHLIQCWAHNVVRVTSLVPDRAVHCIFNNPIKNLRVVPISGGWRVDD